MKRLFNFRTQEYEDLGSLPEEFTDYIPQAEEVQSLYKVLRIRLSPVAAARRIWDVMLGIKREPEEG